MRNAKSLFALSVISSLCFGCGKSGSAPALVSVRLSERTLVLHGVQAFSPRVTAFASEKGIVVFDTSGTPSEAAAFRKRIEREFGRKDFRYVVNTHDHWDHWHGNQAFPEALVVSHDSCPAEMKRPLEAGPHPAPGLGAAADDFTPVFPSLTFSDRMTVDLGGHTLKLYFTGGYETPDDIVACIPEEGLVVLGDTFQRGQYFAAFENGIDVPRWLGILDSVLAGNVRYAVPGHGDPLSREELAEIGKYLELAWAEAGTAASTGSVFSRLDPELIDLEALKKVHAGNVEAFRKRRLLSIALAPETKATLLTDPPNIVRRPREDQ